MLRNPDSLSSVDAKTKVNILIVDDRDDGLLALEAVLSDPDFRLIKARSGREAIACLFENEEIALILLDVQMPGIDGYETAQQIKQIEHLKTIPIIFLTAIHKDPLNVYRGYESGAVDYLFKPFDADVLKSKVQVFADLHRKNLQIKVQAQMLVQAERSEKEREVLQLELESLRRYHSLVDAVPHIIWQAQSNGTIDYFNHVWCSYTGLDLQKSFNLGWQSAFFPEDLDRLLSTWQQAKAGDKDFESECRIRNASGTYRWHLIRGAAEKNREGKVVSWLVTCTDIHDRKIAEKELLEMHRDLEHKVAERTKELAAVNQALREEMNERKKAQRRILEISDREKKRIGQDLHDGLAQQLAAIAFIARILEQKLLEKSVPEASDITQILDLINRSIVETKMLSRGHFPVELERSGLFGALEDLAIQSRTIYNVYCECQFDSEVNIKNEALATHLYRICQEAVHNAIRHGNADQIRISLNKSSQNHLLLTIRDNGAGMSVPDSKGMGLTTMKYRAEMVGGQIFFESEESGGTTVRCKVPLNHSQVELSAAS